MSVKYEHAGVIHEPARTGMWSSIILCDERGIGYVFLPAHAFSRVSSQRVTTCIPCVVAAIVWRL